MPDPVLALYGANFLLGIHHGARPGRMSTLGALWRGRAKATPGRTTRDSIKLDLKISAKSKLHKRYWRALVAGIVLQHESVSSLIRELNRNSSLLALCGFSPVPIQSRDRYGIEPGGGRVTVIKFPLRSPAPGTHNFSRFLSNVVKLEEQQGLISKMIDSLREELMELCPDFGRELGYDGKAVRSNSTGQNNRRKGKTSDPDADWGKHETSGVDSSTAKVWKKIKSWFGYGLHIIADTKYEIPVAFSVRRASVSEVKELERMTDVLFTQDPGLAKRCKYFSADRGLDSGALKKKLWDDYQIRPVIDNRELWSEEKKNRNYVAGQKIMRPLDSVHDNVFYTERAEIWCRCPVSGVERKMAFYGFESDRCSLKFRCPAAVFGLNCKGWAKCHSDAGCVSKGYGRVVRVPLEKDRRIFTPTPCGCASWKRAYRRRSAMERINSRIDNSFRFERHYIRGKAKMTVRVGLAVAVMMALAVGHIKAGRPEKMRSLVSECCARAG